MSKKILLGALIVSFIILSAGGFGQNLPDLFTTVTASNANPSIGEQIIITFKIGNSGNVDAENVKITSIITNLENATETISGNDSYDIIKSGETIVYNPIKINDKRWEANYTYKSTYSKSGKIKYKITLDPDNEISESNENNNVAEIIINVKEPICTDTDGGKDIYKKGVCKDSKDYVNGGLDSCQIKKQDIYEIVESCEGNECFVYDYFCSENKCEGTIIACPNSCKDGACIKGGKPEEFIIKGRLVNKYTKKSLSNILISHVNNKGGWKDLEKTYTDENGNFEFKDNTYEEGYILHFAPDCYSQAGIAGEKNQNTNQYEFYLYDSSEYCNEKKHPIVNGVVDLGDVGLQPAADIELSLDINSSFNIYQESKYCEYEIGGAGNANKETEHYISNIILLGYKNKVVLNEFETNSIKSEFHSVPFKEGCYKIKVNYENGKFEWGKLIPREETTPGEIKCTDTDGGKDYYVKGTVSEYVLPLTAETPDTCLDENKLEEGFCDNGGYSSIDYTCPNGCKDGACILGSHDQTNIWAGGPLSCRIYLDSKISTENLGMKLITDKINRKHITIHLWKDNNGDKGDEIFSSNKIELVNPQTNESGDWGYLDDVEVARSFYGYHKINMKKTLSSGYYWIGVTHSESGSSALNTGVFNDGNSKTYSLVDYEKTPEWDCWYKFNIKEKETPPGEGEEEAVHPEEIPSEEEAPPGMLCNPNSKRCLNDDLQVCNIDGMSWAAIQSCIYGCNPVKLECNPSEEKVCTDSDNGSNLNVRGIAYGLVNDNYATEKDSCKDEFTLTEYICVGNKLEIEEYTCEYGCNDGACVPTENIIAKLLQAILDFLRNLFGG